VKIEKRIRAVFDLYIKWLCKREYKRQKFERFTERAVEFRFLFDKLSMIYPLRVLDVGTGTSALPQLLRKCGFMVTAVDNVKDYWPIGMVNRHYHIINDDITDTKLNDEFDFITCISVLEHVEKYDDAMKNMVKLLKSGGHLVLTFPFSEKKYVKNVYSLPGSSYGQDATYICQSFSRAELEKWTKEYGCKIVDQEYWQFWSGDYWTIGEQVIPPKKVGVEDNHQLTCILMQKL